jgi:hypothetical protein
VYKDAANGNKATVKKLLGGDYWDTVGTNGFTAGPVAYPSIAINSSGTPYVAYLEVAGSVFNGGKITVKKFDGTDWVTVGTTGFSGTTLNLSFTIDGNDIPYVAYSDKDNGEEVTVKRFNGSAWEDVGIPGFSGPTANHVSIVINASGTPYVSYGADNLQWRATVKKFIGGSWVTVGTEGFSAGFSEYLSMDIGPNGIPVVVYSSGDAFAKSIIETSLPLTQPNSRIVTLPVPKTKGAVLVYPNPVNNIAGVTITVDKPERIQVRIIDNMGRIVQSQQWNMNAGSNSFSINMSGIAKGLYYLQVKGNTINKQFRIARQ